jgi:putative ABC transport system permease protein
MLAVTFADLFYRARQFSIAIVGVGLVLSLALALSGLADGFRAEASTTINGVGASSWVMSRNAQGRITAFAAFPETDLHSIADESGIIRASPILLAPGQVVRVGTSTTPSPVDLVGVQLGGLGDPTVVWGRPLSRPRQAVVDSRLQAALGALLHLGGNSYRVVGIVEDRTLDGGAPLVFVPLTDAQLAVTGGRPLITAVVSKGTPSYLPKGLVALAPSLVITETLNQLSSAVATMNNARWLMWFIAAAIVASMLYVAALERRYDFAVLKALGYSSADLFMSLLIEAVVATLAAALLAEVLVGFLTPLFKQPVDVTLGSRLALPLIAVAVGAIAGVAALRRVTGADPAAAFG